MTFFTITLWTTEVVWVIPPGFREHSCDAVNKERIAKWMWCFYLLCVNFCSRRTAGVISLCLEICCFLTLWGNKTPPMPSFKKIGTNRYPMMSVYYEHETVQWKCEIGKGQNEEKNDVYKYRKMLLFLIPSLLFNFENLT